MTFELSTLPYAFGDWSQTLVILLLTFGSLLQSATDRFPFFQNEQRDDRVRVTNRWLAIVFFSCLSVATFAYLYPDNSNPGMKLVAIGPMNLFVIQAILPLIASIHVIGRAKSTGFSLCSMAVVRILGSTIAGGLAIPFRIWQTAKITFEEAFLYLGVNIYGVPRVLSMLSLVLIRFLYFLLLLATAVVPFYAFIACSRLDVHFLLVAELIGTFAADYLRQRQKAAESLQTVLEMMRRCAEAAAAAEQQGDVDRAALAQSAGSGIVRARVPPRQVRADIYLQCWEKGEQASELWSGKVRLLDMPYYLAVLTDKVFFVAPKKLSFEDGSREDRDPTSFFHRMIPLLFQDSPYRKIHRRVHYLHLYFPWSEYSTIYSQYPLDRQVREAAKLASATREAQSDEQATEPNGTSASMSSDRLLSIPGQVPLPSPADAATVSNPQIELSSVNREAQPEEKEEIVLPPIPAGGPLSPAGDPNSAAAWPDDHEPVSIPVDYLKPITDGEPKCDPKLLKLFKEMTGPHLRLDKAFYDRRRIERELLGHGPKDKMTLVSELSNWNWTPNSLLDSWFNVWAGTRAIVIASIAFERLRN